MQRRRFYDFEKLCYACVREVCVRVFCLVRFEVSEFVVESLKHS